MSYFAQQDHLRVTALTTPARPTVDPKTGVAWAHQRYAGWKFECVICAALEEVTPAPDNPSPDARPAFCEFARVHAHGSTEIEQWLKRIEAGDPA